MQKVFRHLVSQNKKRHQEGDFDLDLTYLTDEIIAMGLPASGSEAIYRNPIDEVVRFLETHHAERYKVFNLCNERSYDISKFGASCASFPFDDHGAPPMALVCAFCASAKSWLLGSLENVVVVHCKAGKGRTGVMVCCLLLHLGYHRDADAAIEFYNHRRTRDGRGLTVPSQRRYVRYYARQLSARPSLAVMPRLLVGVQVDGVPAGLPYLTIVLQVRHPRLSPRRAATWCDIGTAAATAGAWRADGETSAPARHRPRGRRRRDAGASSDSLHARDTSAHAHATHRDMHSGSRADCASTRTSRSSSTRPSR